MSKKKSDLTEAEQAARELPEQLARVRARIEEGRRRLTGGPKKDPSPQDQPTDDPKPPEA